MKKCKLHGHSLKQLQMFACLLQSCLCVCICVCATAWECGGVCSVDALHVCIDLSTSKNKHTPAVGDTAMYACQDRCVLQTDLTHVFANNKLTTAHLQHAPKPMRQHTSDIVLLNLRVKVHVCMASSPRLLVKLHSFLPLSHLNCMKLLTSAGTCN